MASMTIDDPDFVARKNVDSNGRVYLGKAHADQSIRIIIPDLPEENRDGDE